MQVLANSYVNIGQGCHGFGDLVKKDLSMFFYHLKNISRSSQVAD